MVTCKRIRGTRSLCLLQVKCVLGPCLTFLAAMAVTFQLLESCSSGIINSIVVSGRDVLNGFFYPDERNESATTDDTCKYAAVYANGACNPADIWRLNCTVNVTYGVCMETGLRRAYQLLKYVRSDVSLENLIESMRNRSKRMRLHAPRMIKVEIDREFWMGQDREAFVNVRGVRIRLVAKRTSDIPNADSYYVDKLYPGSMTLDVCRAIEKKNPKEMPDCAKSYTDLGSTLNPMPRTSPVRDDSIKRFASQIFIVSGGSIDGTTGGVFSNGHFFLSDQCDLERFGAAVVDTVSIGFGITFHKKVFVVTQTRGRTYYHNTIEEMSRIAPFVSFLRDNPDVRVHASASEHAREVLMLYKIHPDRLISGNAAAELIYLPRGSGCRGQRGCTMCVQGMAKLFRPDSVPTQVSNTSMHPNATTAYTIPSSRLPRNIVLVQETARLSHYLSNHLQVWEMLERVAREFNLSCVVFSEASLPVFQKTLDVFRSALVIVSLSGSGLTSMIFAPKGTFVIEILSEDDLSFCYRTLSYQLGHRWHGTMGETIERAVTANLSHVQSVVRLVLTHWKKENGDV